MLGWFLRANPVVRRIDENAVLREPLPVRVRRTPGKGTIPHVIPFSKPLLETLRAAKILGVRAGKEHRYTGVWVVVVEDRVFVRSWNDKPTGWYRAFRAERDGRMQVGDREIAVTGKSVRSARLRDAVTRAYGEKYDTKASQKWVRGFAEPKRESNTLELVAR